jgi:hypothetical protein
MSARVQQGDVERILRDVVTTEGLQVTVQRVHRVAEGWRAIVKDAADRMRSIDLPDGAPAVIRQALTRWAANYE